MRIGFIGAGNIAKVFGKHLVIAGNEIVISNSRGPETLAELVAELGPSAKAGTKDQAVECEVVILATNWTQAQKALEGVKWHGQILIDAVNAHEGSPPDISSAGVAKSIAALNGRISSQMIAEWAPGARLVKAISNIPMAWITDFSDQKPKTIMFVSGDDQSAKRVVISIMRSVGFEPIDLGSLVIGGTLYQVGGPLSGLDLRLVQRMRPPTY
jgi:predicted dinucleotide-binding enzyme